jgi:excisionase family DNA binding protein
MVSREGDKVMKTKKPETGKLFYTSVEVAEILHYSRPTISLKIKSGEIPAIRPSGKLRGRVLIPASYIEKLEEEAIKNYQAPGAEGKNNA